MAITDLMRFAAASVSRIICGLSRAVAIMVRASFESRLNFACDVVLRDEKVIHNMLRTTRASSDIRLGSQGGSQTTLTSTFPTPGTVETAFCTITGSSCADGQLGEVSDMSTFTVRSSAMSMR